MACLPPFSTGAGFLPIHGAFGTGGWDRSDARDAGWRRIFEKSGPKLPGRRLPVGFMVKRRRTLGVNPKLLIC